MPMQKQRQRSIAERFGVATKAVMSRENTEIGIFLLLKIFFENLI